MENKTAQHQFNINDVVVKLKSLGGRHDRFGLAMEMTRHIGDPMQVFGLIQEAIKAKKLRCIKIGHR